MTPPAVGLGTLSRLNALFARPQVLSVYLDACPARAAGCAEQCMRLVEDLPSPREDLLRARVQAMLDGDSALAFGTRSIALFVAEDGPQALVPLPLTVEPMAVMDCVPWLEPLAGMLTCGNWGAAIVDWRAARLLRGGPAGLIEFAFLGEQVSDRLDASAGRSASASCPASVATQWVQEHRLELVRRLANMLARAHHRRPFERIAVAAPRKLWRLIEPQLSETLRERLVGVLAVEHTADLRLRKEVVEVLRSARDEGLCCARSTSTPLRGPSVVALNHTTASLMARLPQGQVVGDLAEGREPLAHLADPGNRSAAPSAGRDDLWTPMMER